MLTRTVSQNVTLRRYTSSFLFHTISLRNFTRERPSSPSVKAIGDPALIERIKNHITQLHLTDGGVPSDSDVELFNQSFIQLQQALRDRHLSAVSNYWSILNRRNLRTFLGPSQLESFSRLIVCLWPDQGPRGSWNERERQVIEEIALFAAARRSPDALNGILISYLRRNDSEAVLKLYDRFLELLDQNWKGEEVDDDGGYDALASTSTMNLRGHSPGLVTILLAVITAHAMRNSFSDALQASINSNIRFSPYSVKEYLKRLDHDTSLHQKLEVYTRKLGIARLVIRSPSLIKHITNLAKDSSVKQLERFYSVVLEGLSGPHAYLTTDPTSKDSDKVVITEVVWTSFLSGFLRCRRLDLAEKLWDDILRLGIPVGISLWTALFDGYHRMDATDDALTGWEAMLSQGVEPEALTYRAIISTLFKGKQPEVAMTKFRRFEEALRVGSLPQQPAQILSVYNTTLHGLLRNSREDEATALFQTMRTTNPKPDVVSYNTFVQYYARKGDFRSIAAYIREMTSDNLVGDVFTFSTILSALLKVGRQDAPEMMLSLMAKQGIEPNVATFTAIIDHQMREQDIPNLQAALRLLQSMEQNPDTQPNEVTYTTILAGIYNGPWLDPRVAEEYRMDIVQRMTERDIHPNGLTYQILLRACLQYHEPEGLRNALRYYREMVQRKIFMSQEIWYTLLRGLADRGEWGIATEMLMDMKRSGFQPVGAVANLVERIRKRQERIR